LQIEQPDICEESLHEKTSIIIDQIGPQRGKAVFLIKAPQEKANCSLSQNQKGKHDRDGSDIEIGDRKTQKKCHRLLLQWPSQFEYFSGLT
jgi:hypothetical protein